MRWRKITLIGVGLLGGSMGLALKRRGLASTVAGYVRREESARECTRLGVVDQAGVDLEAAVAEADLLIFCTPVAQMPVLARIVAAFLKKGALATDVGSVKTGLVNEMQSILGGAGIEFVGSHPMAGSERTGPEAAREDLFEKAACVVTPTAANTPEAISAVDSLWTALGGRVIRMPPELHDELVGRSSHLPHVVAAALASAVLNPEHDPVQRKLCATGFRDATRIASGSPEMWRDIALGNRDQLSRAMDDYITRLREFRLLLEKEDAPGIEKFFQTAKARRDAWASGCASPSPE